MISQTDQNQIRTDESTAILGSSLPLPKGYKDGICPECKEAKLTARKRPNGDEQDPTLKCESCGLEF